MKRVSWTSAEDARLARMREANLPVAIIAKAMVRSVSAVSSRAHRIGAPRNLPKGHFWTVEEDAKLKEAAATAAGWQEIADVVGRTVLACKTRGEYLGIRLDRDRCEPRRIRLAAEGKRRPQARINASNGQKASWTPERRAQQSEKNRATNAAAKMLATPRDEERRLAGVQRWAASRRSWMPEYLWDRYRQLQRRHLYCAAEARAIILNDFDRDLRRALKDIAAAAKPYAEEQRRQYHSFEAELERARVKGIREVVLLVRPDYEFSLTGGSLA